MKTSASNQVAAESKRFLKRSMLCASGILIIFLIIFVRLIYLQLFEHQFYETLSKQNVISIVPVKPNRGLIYDRNGVVLAKNVPIYSLMVIPGRVKNLKNTVSELTTLLHLKPEEIQNFYHMLKQYYPYQAVPLKQQLTENEAALFYVDQYRFPGVSIQTNMLRVYPQGSAFGNVIGYVGRINAKELASVNPTNYTASDEIGKAGVEKEDEVLLHGTTGAEEAEIDANGKIVRILKMTPPIPGDNIYLTIDSKLQSYAEKLMGDTSGAIVAIQPETGQVLALVSNPSYDPNLFVDGMTTKQYQSILTAPNNPLFNRAIRGLYAPGSTVKPFIAFSALNLGIINSKDSLFDTGSFRVPNTEHVFYNWKRNGFGWVNVSKAIMFSCDTFFYQLAVTLGIDRLDKALTQFGFGQLTGINLPAERAGIVPSPKWKMGHIGQPWYAGDTVVAGIGQGYILTTPLQLTAAVATLAERGQKFQPSLLLKLEQPNGNSTLLQPIAEDPLTVTNPTAFPTVIDAMQQVVSNPEGTAYSSFLNTPYTVAGKSGTAQIVAVKAGSKNVTTLNNHLFVSFAPVNHPEIALTVVVERIPGMSQEAVKISRKLLDFYMKELADEKAKMPPTPEQILLPPTDNLTPLPKKNSAFTEPTSQLPSPKAALPMPTKTGSQLPSPSASTDMNTTTDSTTDALAAHKRIQSPYLDQLQEQMEERVNMAMEASTSSN